MGIGVYIEISENGISISEEFTRCATKREFKGKSSLGFPSKFVVVDIETTGLNPKYDSIIEIGAIRFEDGKEIEKFAQLVKPDQYYTLSEDDIKNTDDFCYIDNTPIQYVPEYITQLTGITNKMLERADTIEEVLPKFAKFLGSDIIVGHNVNFDINFLYDSFMAALKMPLKNDFIDTMRISKRILKDLKHHRLRDIVEHYGINSKGAHRALYDCYNTEMCFEKLKNDVENSFGSLEEFVKVKQSYHNLNARDITTTIEKFDETHPLFGKVCVFTGKLEKMERKDAMHLVVDLGGENGDSVTKNTNYLILGNNDYCTSIKDGKSNKHKKAEQLKLEGKDIEIIAEDVFYDMLGM